MIREYSVQFIQQIKQQTLTTMYNTFIIYLKRTVTSQQYLEY